MTRQIKLITVLTITAAMLSAADAEIYIWDGGGSDSRYRTAENWNPAAPEGGPKTGDTATVGGSYVVTINSQYEMAAGAAITMQDHSVLQRANVSTLSINGGLTFNDGSRLVTSILRLHENCRLDWNSTNTFTSAGSSTSAAAVNFLVSGADTNAGTTVNMTAGYWQLTGNSNSNSFRMDTGTFNLTGGTIFCGGSFYLGGNAVFNLGGTGELFAGSLTAASASRLNFQGTDSALYLAGGDRRDQIAVLIESGTIYIDGKPATDLSLLKFDNITVDGTDYTKVNVSSGVNTSLVFAIGTVPLRKLSLNPYRDVQWDSTGHYKANLHTHTTASDGSWNPHQVVDQYHQEGYRILAITDHDNYAARTTWPWQEFDKIRPSTRSLSYLADGKFSNFCGNLTYENRDPADLGMIAIQGHEISRTLHAQSLFSDWHSTSSNLDEQLRGAAARGGLAVMNHPAHHWTKVTPLPAELPEATVQNYIELYTTHTNLMALEIVNGAVPITHRPYDRAVWDRVLEALMPERPVWGMASDDMHSKQFGIGWVVFLAPVFDEASVRQAFVDGAFYFSGVSSVPAAPGTYRFVPKIERIVHDAETGRITLTASENGIPVPETACVWIGQDGKPVHRGLSIEYRSIPGIRNYVRAEISGSKGTTFTNPFGFTSP